MPASLEALLEALAADRALSAAQVAQHYGLDAPGLGRPVRIVTAYTAPTHGTRQARPVAFATLEPALIRASGTRLRHLAGVAELRHVLQAPTASWRQARPNNGLDAPDAVFETPSGPVAVEFDSGAYSPAQVRAKGAAFAAYAAQVWGTPSARRAGHLADLLAGAAAVHLVTWDQVPREDA